MQTQKKLTVTFPLYQQHEMVERAFTALTHQTYKDFCVVGIDDQSPTAFTELKEYFSRSLDITLEKNEHNLGAMLNIWKSIQLETTSPYLLSHHADDYLKCDYLEKAITILEENPDVSFVLTGPKWVAADAVYHKEFLGDVPVTYFDAADFAKNILEFAPYIFGSVVYRTNHRINDWRYAEMNTYADRYFLGEILRTHQSRGAYVHGFGIVEHDHSLDASDTRSPTLHEEHAIALLGFYKELLLQKYPQSQTETIITNALLYYYGNFTPRSPLRLFYKKQQSANLIQWRRLRPLGIYALLTLGLSPKGKRRMIQLIKKVRAK